MQLLHAVSNYRNIQAPQTKVLEGSASSASQQHDPSPQASGRLPNRDARDAGPLTTDNDRVTISDAARRAAEAEPPAGPDDLLAAPADVVTAAAAQLLAWSRQTTPPTLGAILGIGNGVDGRRTLNPAWVSEGHAWLQGLGETQRQSTVARLHDHYTSALRDAGVDPSTGFAGPMFLDRQVEERVRRSMVQRIANDESLRALRGPGGS